MSKKPKRHIVILGAMAYQDKDPLPKKKPGMEFWAQNAIEQGIYPKVSHGWSKPEMSFKTEDAERDNVAMLAEVVDRWYEIHEPELTLELHPKHLEWLGEVDMKVYAQYDAAVWLDWRIDVEPYPIAEVQALTPHGRYLAGSFSYMVAHAILEGVDKISFHWMSKGVVRSPREPRDAQANLEYWLGVAEGRGIEVDPGELWLLRTWWDGRYGYDGMPPEWHEQRAEGQYRDYLTGDYDYEPVLKQLEDYVKKEKGDHDGYATESEEDSD